MSKNIRKKITYTEITVTVPNFETDNFDTLTIELPGNRTKRNTGQIAAKLKELGYRNQYEIKAISVHTRTFEMSLAKFMENAVEISE